MLTMICTELGGYGGKLLQIFENKKRLTLDLKESWD